MQATAHFERKAYADYEDEINAGTVGVLSKLTPISWFHDLGRYRVLARLEPRLPDVGGSLFITFTIDQKRFENHREAHEYARERLRKVFARLRKGVKWKDDFGVVKTVRIDAPYCVKVEFHKSGGAHYHVIFRTRRYVSKHLVAKIWGLGFCDVQRITNDEFRYLLKYVTKDGGPLPEWVKEMKLLRIFQPSKGFYEALPDEGDIPETDEEKQERAERAESTIGERVERWRFTAIYRVGKQFKQIILPAYFEEIYAALSGEIALSGRLNAAKNRIIIETQGQLEPWITYQTPEELKLLREIDKLLLEEWEAEHPLNRGYTFRVS